MGMNGMLMVINGYYKLSNGKNQCLLMLIDGIHKQLMGING